MASANDILINNVYEQVDNIIRTVHSTSPKAVVITPSTGSPYLFKAIESVLAQSFQEILHLIVVDGIEYEQEVRLISSHFNSERCKIVTLPFNTGKKGMNGHRIYASFPLLVNSDYIFFLDEDNWWESDHANSLITLMEFSNIDWAFSMRKIYTYDQVYVADDNCESIGDYTPFSGIKKKWPSYVDTNCYAFKRNTIAQTAHYWYHPLRADRYFFHQLIVNFPKYSSSKMYTLNYRLKKQGPIAPDYILEGNQYMKDKYPCGLPWVL
ncbi:glycosyltransferase family A protein [Xanthocytophaga flava]|uniref:glycosyltransferase family A protein n=1 Tax=Xanthocytophaga flava TaxID=3048013 RepID=UPI0028D59490|nr:glycosyltransferase family A protein [Xanthocytophaga flavus]MDJ1473228.1 glycosyltransferase family A protein [Xanthocytophaga flavus]